MKALIQRSLLLLFMGSISVSMNAQSINLQTAIDEVDDDNLKEAYKYIKKAEKHSDTKNIPKTWFYKAQILRKIAQSKDSTVRKLAEDPVKRAQEALKKCRMLDNNDEFKRQLGMEGYKLTGPAYLAARQAYNERAFQKAFELFSYSGMLRYQMEKKSRKRAEEAGKDVEDMPRDTIAYEAMFYAARSARNMKKDSIENPSQNPLASRDSIAPEEMALSLYKRLAETGFYKGDAYLRAADVLKKMEKPDSTVLTMIEEGLEKYPEHAGLINRRAQFYIDQGDYTKAEKSLEKAVEKQPENKGLKLILASVYDQLSKDMKADSAALAKKYFKKAGEKYSAVIGKDSSNYEALRALGLMYYNKGVELYKGGEKPEQDRAKKLWNKGVLVLEKAFEMKKNDETVARSLMKIYARLSKPDAYKRVKKKAGFSKK